MKLVDILALELKEWPEGVQVIIQQQSGYLFDESNYPLDILVSESEDCFCATVPRAQWQAAVDALNHSEADSVSSYNDELEVKRQAHLALVWNGEGLPPVGTDVDVVRSDCSWIAGDEWQIGRSATVMAAFCNSAGHGMAAIQFSGGHCECILAKCLRPIRTPEQIAAEDRDKAIAEIAKTSGLRKRDGAVEVATALYNAGYRKCGS